MSAGYATPTTATEEPMLGNQARSAHLRLALAIAALILSQSARADIITYKFTGKVDRVDIAAGTVVGDPITVGSAFTASVSFDSSGPDLAPDDPEIGEFRAVGQAPTMTFRLAGVDVDQDPQNVELQVRARECGDAPHFNCSPAGTFDHQLTFAGINGFGALFGWTPTALVLGLADSLEAILFGDGMPKSVDLDRWDLRSWRVTGGGTKISGSLDTVSVVRAVPEPSSLMIILPGLLIGTILTRRRLR